MIPRSDPSWQIPWQQELQHLITNPKELLELAQIDLSLLPLAQLASKQFPLRVTRAYADRIVKGDIHDPLLRQVLPLQDELIASAGFSPDPLAETEFTALPGLVHKYRSRVLMITATQCAINCRYCFRREFPYADNHMSRDQWLNALTYVRERAEINEVILSGGDPLAVSDAQLAWLFTQLASIKHLTRVRIHTRLPVVLPSRVTSELLSSINSTHLQTIVVIHSNHANEIDEAVTHALQRIYHANLFLFNQSVLLRGVNDSAEVLTRLSEKLFQANVLPYYLHLLDPVKGAAHFQVDEQRAKQIYQQMLERLPGFLVPKLVREIPKKASKTPVSPY